MEIKRGDIWMVDFGPPEDDEDHLQHSIRPVVIVSNNRANEHSMVLHAVPLTSKIKKKRYMPTHVFINGFQAEGLDRHSICIKWIEHINMPARCVMKHSRMWKCVRLLIHRK